MTQNTWSNGIKAIDVNGQQVAVLDEDDAEKYLGRKLCFGNVHESELQNRIASGWAAFHKHKAELCSPTYPIEDRVRLFVSVVSPAVLYGASTWVLLKEDERILRTTWRRMLRYIFRLHRRKPCKDHLYEDWAQYMQRTARRAETLAEKHGIESWVRAHRRLNRQTSSPHGWTMDQSHHGMGAVGRTLQTQRSSMQAVAGRH